MADDGIRHALAFVTSAFASYSGCRQYLEDIDRAREAIGPAAPRVSKLRPFFNHPGFIEANASGVRTALASLLPVERARTELVHTAHSIPAAMARSCHYEAQFREASSLVAAAAGCASWTVAYQSRSGPSTEPWLCPDLLEHMGALRRRGAERVVVCPVGFVSDHMEVVYDLDTQARVAARQMGLAFLRTPTAGTHPAFVSMIAELVAERTSSAPRRSLGRLGPSPDECAPDCCPPPVRAAHGRS
jgi:ferrochelatase